MAAGGQPREDADVESSSERYARRFEGPVGRWFLDYQTRITLECLAGLAAGATILDVGGGHAQIAPPLVEAGYQVTVVGSDPSCGQRLRSLISAGQCRFEVGDLQALPYDPESFDAVICYRLIAHSIDWRRLIGQVCRVARHRTIVDYPARRSVNVASQVLFRVKHSIERGTTRPFTLYGRGEITRAFTDAGFSIRSVHPQFFLPMALYRWAGSVPVARATEGLARATALTSLMGSPVIARADRRPERGGPPAR
jgi:ubiquinone/menaquinone biosynthesis C-methylase UbiE